MSTLVLPEVKARRRQRVKVAKKQYARSPHGKSATVTMHCFSDLKKLSHLFNR
jgi:hypothetical protein